MRKKQRKEKVPRGYSEAQRAEVWDRLLPVLKTSVWVGIGHPPAIA